MKARPAAPLSRKDAAIACCLLLLCVVGRGQRLDKVITLPYDAMLPAGHNSIAFNPQARLLYISGSKSESLCVMDERKSVVTAMLDLGYCVSSLCFNPRVGKLYCAAGSSCAILALEGVSGSVLSEIRVPDALTSLVLDSAHNRVYGLCRNGAIAVVDCSQDRLLCAPLVASALGDTCPAVCVEGLDRLYVGSSADSTVFVFDCAGDSVLARIDLASTPLALCYHTPNGLLYCSCADDTNLLVINPTSNQPVDSVPGAGGNLLMCSNSTSNKVYVVVEGDLLAVSGETNTVLANIYGGDSYSLTWNSRRNKVYLTTSSW